MSPIAVPCSSDRKARPPDATAEPVLQLAPVDRARECARSLLTNSRQYSDVVLRARVDFVGSAELAAEAGHFDGLALAQSPGDNEFDANRR